jgi:hypothetical protein
MANNFTDEHEVMENDSDNVMEEFSWEIEDDLGTADDEHSDSTVIGIPAATNASGRHTCQRRKPKR